MFGGVKRNAADRDLSAETDIDVVPGLSRSPVEVPGVAVVLALDLESNGVGTRVRGTVRDRANDGFVHGMGKIDVPEGPVSRRLLEQAPQDRSGAKKSLVPVRLTVSPDILGNGESGEAKNGRLSGSGGGARDVKIDTQIGALVDSGDQPNVSITNGFGPVLCQRRPVGEGHPRAICRRSMDRVTVGPVFDSDGLARGQGMSDPALGTGRCHDLYGCEALQ